MSLEQRRKKRHPIIVPYWIAKQIDRNKLAYNVIFDLAKLSTISSNEDLAMLFAINNSMDLQCKLFGAVANTSLYGVWDSTNRELTRKIKEIVPLIEEQISHRLFVGDVNNTLSSEYPKPFEIRSIDSVVGDDHALMIIIYPGHFGGSSTRQIQKQLVREYLKQSYVFSNYENVAKDRLFLQYVRSL